MDILLTLTPAQISVLKKLDALKTARQVLQSHVDTWLAPQVLDMVKDERRVVATAYERADDAVQEQVKVALGLG